jgi:hypothetical protein
MSPVGAAPAPSCVVLPIARCFSYRLFLGCFNYYWVSLHQSSSVGILLNPLNFSWTSLPCLPRDYLWVSLQIPNCASSGCKGCPPRSHWSTTHLYCYYACLRKKCGAPRGSPTAGFSRCQLESFECAVWKGCTSTQVSTQGLSWH